MEHEHKTQGDVSRWKTNTRHKVMKIDGTRTQDIKWCKSMEHEHKTQSDVNRWNTNTRHKVMLIDGKRTRDTRWWKSMKHGRHIKRSKVLNGSSSRGGVRVSKPYSSEELGSKQIGNFQNMEGEKKKINNKKFRIATSWCLLFQF